MTGYNPYLMTPYGQGPYPYQPPVNNQTVAGVPNGTSTIQTALPSTPQGQPIQKIEKTLETQAFCYFVTSDEDMKSLKVVPDTYYVGINTKDREIYIRKMEDDGTAVLEKYKFDANTQEKTELQIINEKLTSIEKALSQLPKQREILTLKGKVNES